MEYRDIVFSRRGGVAEIVLNRPEQLNAVGPVMVAELAEAVEECARDEGIKAVVLRGAGRAFCGGGDIRTMVDSLNGKCENQRLGAKLGRVALAIRRLPKPVICAVQGAAAGGGANLALFCDLVIASEDAKFIESFVNIGLAPDTAGGFLLPRMLGPARAFKLLSTARPIRAAEAMELGLISEVCPAKELSERAMSWAERYASGPSLAYARLKEQLNMSVCAGLEQYLDVEAGHIDALRESADFREGVTAFLEKRKAAFEGK